MDIKNLRVVRVSKDIFKGFKQILAPVRSYMPDILLAGGTASIIGAGVLACRSTLKAQEPMKKAKNDISEAAKLPEGKIRKKAAFRIVARTAADISKLYAGPILLGGTGIYAIRKGRNQLVDQNTKLALLLGAVTTEYLEYKKKAEEKGIVSADILKEIREEKEQEDPLEKAADIHNDPGFFARFFDNRCHGWSRNRANVLLQLDATERTLTDKLKQRGYLTFNEMCDVVGCSKAAYGQVWGWKYDENDISLHNCVSFGLTEEKKRRYLEGIDEEILLEPNIDSKTLVELDAFHGRIAL